MTIIELRRVRRAAAVLLLAALVAGTRAVAGGEFDDQDAAIARLGDPTLMESGRQRFNQACSYCHGKEGEGGKTKSFKGRNDLKPRAVFDTISNGRRRGANIMPPWKNTLSEGQIWELVAYILSLGNASGGQ